MLDRRLKVRGIPEAVGLSPERAYLILTVELGRKDFLLDGYRVC